MLVSVHCKKQNKNETWKKVSMKIRKKFLELYLKSQKGSNVTLVLPQTVHFSELLSWPTNKSLITDFSTFEYQSHVRSALILSDKVSSISSFSPLVPLFSAQCNASKKNRKNSWASCCEQPLYIRCFDENANFNSLGVTELYARPHFFDQFRKFDYNSRIFGCRWRTNVAFYFEVTRQIFGMA